MQLRVEQTQPLFFFQHSQPIAHVWLTQTDRIPLSLNRLDLSSSLLPFGDAAQIRIVVEGRLCGSYHLCRSAMPIFAVLIIASPTLWVFLLTVTACGLLLRHRALVTSTTLSGPWRWMLGSLSAIGGTQLVVAFTASGSMDISTGWTDAVTFAAAATSFCPVISLLGAKRPQDRGWHFVVLSLWAILVLPVAESLVLRHGQMPDLQGARSWFMLILIALGVVNSLPTRFWFAAVLFGSGQVMMLAASLPLARDYVESSQTAIGVSCCALACIVALQLACRRRKMPASLNLVWHDFRDSFGMLWGLRVAEQINFAARSSGWPLTLRWQGFVDEQGKPLDLDLLPEETRKSLDQAIQNLLRRFVSPEWIAARMGNGIDLQ
ncbi:MAG: hypothetical protein H8E66_19435 [Planctomycetes bacterium]|nr:hypothetical protein [Planctomycetota bacterium]